MTRGAEAGVDLAHAQQARSSGSAWTRTGRTAAYVAAGALSAQSVLYLVDVTGLIEPLIAFRPTAAGLQADLATFYAAYHERQHRLWWNVAARDVLGPVGYLALVVLALALRHVLGRGHPRVELTALFLSVGALTAATADVAFLSQLATWRGGGFRPTPDIIAFGRASEVVDNLIDTVRYAGWIVLASGFACLGASLSAGGARTGLIRLAYAEAAVLLAVVVTHALGLGLAHTVAVGVGGLVLGPALVVLAGRSLPDLPALRT